MPARRKRKVPEPQEESEVMDNSEDEDRLYGSASPSSSSTSSEPATRGPNKEKADAAYQEAAEELDAMRRHIPISLPLHIPQQPRREAERRSNSEGKKPRRDPPGVCAPPT